MASVYKANVGGGMIIKSEPLPLNQAKQILARKKARLARINVGDTPRLHLNVQAQVNALETEINKFPKE